MERALSVMTGYMDKRTIDRGTLLGVISAVTGIVVGLMLDGGSLRQILQPTAAFIVLGGTCGAILIQFPIDTVLSAIHDLRFALFEHRDAAGEAIEDLLSHCTQARRHGILKLDSGLDQIADPFLRKCLTFAVDGIPVPELRDMLEVDLCLLEARDERMVQVLEAAGGFSPTLGIVGAVLGLIQVMQHMDNVSEIGKGIAAAFVSTLYGIGLSNLCFLPLAGKLRIRMRERQLVREMMLEASILIVDGVSARALRRRLDSYKEQHAQQLPLATSEMAIR